MIHILDVDQFFLVFSYVLHALLSLTMIFIVVFFGLAIFDRARDDNSIFAILKIFMIPIIIMIWGVGALYITNVLFNEATGATKAFSAILALTFPFIFLWSINLSYRKMKNIFKQE